MAYAMGPISLAGGYEMQTDKSKGAGLIVSHQRVLPPDPPYIGALPLGPAPPEGDWFTRLRERWREVLEESGESRDKSPEPVQP